MKTLITQCKHCKNKFQVLEKELNRGNGKFCSLSCSSKHQKRQSKKVQCTCYFCNESFYRVPSKLKNSKSGLYFCSRTCKDNAQRLHSGIIPLQPSHYNNGHHIRYRRLAFDNLPHLCALCGYSDNPEILEVHHKDCNRKNNSLDNLQILCPNCHAVYHLQNRRSPR